jgi:hypothetical protein
MVFDLLGYFVALVGSLLSTDVAHHPTLNTVVRYSHSVIDVKEEEEATEMNTSKSYAKHYN